MNDWLPAEPAAIADHLARVLAAAGAIVAMPGGRTPLPILDVLARPDMSGTVWPTDDRIVPHGHPASNYGMLRRALPTLKVVALREGETVPRFDLVWIGMGADGHIASVFPNAVDGLVAGRTVRRMRPDPLPPEAPFDRLTLTIEALANTGQAVLVISGAVKARVLRSALAGDTDLPISRYLAALKAPTTVYWSEA